MFGGDAVRRTWTPPSASLSAAFVVSSWAESVIRLRQASFLQGHRFRSRVNAFLFLGELFNDSKLRDMAHPHVQSVKQTLLRDDFSTFHIVNLVLQNGHCQAAFTAQGDQHSATWAK